MVDAVGAADVGMGGLGDPEVDSFRAVAMAMGFEDGTPGLQRAEVETCAN